MKRVKKQYDIICCQITRVGYSLTVLSMLQENHSKMKVELSGFMEIRVVLIEIWTEGYEVRSPS